MAGLLVFSVVLLLAVLLSEVIHRTVLSSTLLFLVAGFVVGHGVLGWFDVGSNNPVVSSLADFALCSVLFTDGLKLSLRDLASGWELPGRALLIGLPLTLGATALAAHFAVGVAWLPALLVGAVLSPTDPVFASAIVGREEIPARLRHLLNVESGLNDGLALPIVVTLLTLLRTGSRLQLGKEAFELGLGVAIGVAIPLIACTLERSRFFSVASRYEPLFAFSIGLLVLTTSETVGGNEYLASFAAGVTIASTRPDLEKEFEGFGRNLTALLKLGAVMVFGALISPRFLLRTSGWELLFLFLALVVARPLGLWVAEAGTELDWKERLAAFWFGPKGFASVIYGLLVLKSGIPDARALFHLIGLVIIASMVAHSTTDVVVARWFRKEENEPAPTST